MASSSSGFAEFIEVHPWGPWGHGCTMEVVGFIRGSCVNFCALWGSSGSSGVATFIVVRPECRRVHPGSFGCALTVVGFIPGLWRCALGLVGFILGHWVHWVHPGCCLVHPGWLVSLGCALGVVGLLRCLWVHWGAPWETSGSSWVAGFIGMRPRCRLVHPGSLCSFGCVLEVVGLIRVDWGAPWGSSGSSVAAGFIGVRSGGRWVHLVSLGSLWCALGVVRFSLGSLGTLLVTFSSFGVAGFIGVRPGVIGFIRGRQINSGAPRRSSDSSGIAGLIAVGSSGSSRIAGFIGGLRIHPGFHVLLGYAPGIITLIKARLDHWSAPWGSSGSSCVDVLIRV